MSELENSLVDKAIAIHKKIFPCSRTESLADCFTRHENKLFFWYNTEDQSTHVLCTEVPYVGDSKQIKKNNPTFTL